MTEPERPPAHTASATRADPIPNASSPTRAIVLAAGLAVIAACHLPTLGFGFLAWDDELHVTRNATVRAPDSVPLRDRLTTPALGYPIPVTVESYALEARWLGLSPWHFHLFNVVAHLVNSALVFAIGLRLGLTPLGALCAMLLFGLHPVVAEPVSWVTGRKDLLCAVFALSTLLLAWPPASPRRRAAAWSCYALGLLSKPSIAPVCLLVALADALFGHADAWNVRTRMRGALHVLLPYLAISAPVILLGLAGQHAVGAIADMDHAGAGFVRSVWYALGHHLRLVLGLEEPTAKYLPWPWPPSFTPGVDLMPLLAAGITLTALWWLPSARRRSFGFGAAWAALSYLPNSNLIPLARYLADTYVYLPLIGLAFCAGTLVDALAARSERVAAVARYALPLIIVLSCAPALLPSAQRFANDRKLWAHALRRNPHSARVCRQWANGVTIVAGPSEGLHATDRCLEAFGEELFARNKGILLGRLGRVDEARVWLDRAQRGKEPDRVPNASAGSASPTAAGPHRAP